MQRVAVSTKTGFRFVGSDLLGAGDDDMAAGACKQVAAALLNVALLVP